MASEKSIIRVLSEPTIELDDLESKDIEEGTDPNNASPSSPVKYSKQYGGAFPLVKINEYVFTTNQVMTLELLCVSELPSINITLNITDKSFYSTSYPKDGDVLTVFIRSKNDVFKPIRNDYEITSINSIPRDGGDENTPDTITLSGVLRVPGYFATKCFSKRGTAMNVIHRTAADLKLGFASNEVDTSDEQAWICPYDKVSDFLYNTTSASWNNDKSFYTYFIDQYYYLNFVNIESMFSEKTDIDTAMVTSILTNDYVKDSEKAEHEGKLILSDWDELSMTNFYIMSYNINNNAASINNTHGYRRYAMFYDGLTKESVKIYSDPITTDGAEQDQILLKGRAGEDIYKQQVQNKWMGVQYGDNGENCHENYNVAKITNFQNTVHLDKMSMSVRLKTANFNLRRMQTIPVIIIVKKDTTRKIINEPIDDNGDSPKVQNENNKTQTAVKADELPFVIDKTLSGNYVIQKIIYTYKEGFFNQECVLIRREWSTPPQTH